VADHRQPLCRKNTPLFLMNFGNSTKMATFF
jgi:hypothetical protein